MVHVVGVISSPHVGGNSATLLREALAGARAAGAETAELILSKLDIGYCTGCMRCSERGSCVQSDDFEEVRRTLQEAEAIILSSPTYGAAPCARLKNLFDRLGLFEYMTSSVFGGKYVATISTAKSFGAKNACDYMASVPLGTVFERAYISGTLPAILKGGKQASQFPQYMKRARDLGSRVVDDCVRGRRHPLQNLFPRMLNAALMRPMIAKGIEERRDQEMGGVYRNLADRGLLGVRS